MELTEEQPPPHRGQPHRRSREAQRAAEAAAASASTAWRLAKCPRIDPPLHLFLVHRRRLIPFLHRRRSLLWGSRWCWRCTAVTARTSSRWRWGPRRARPSPEMPSASAPPRTASLRLYHSLRHKVKAVIVLIVVDYDLVLKCLKKLPGIVVQDIPYRTRNVVQNLDKNWASDEEVDELLTKLPQHLQDAPYPFNLKA